MYSGLCPLKLRTHQHKRRSNIRLCRKNRSTCSIRQCHFDIVAGVDGALRSPTPSAQSYRLCAGGTGSQFNVSRKCLSNVLVPAIPVISLAVLMEDEQTDRRTGSQRDMVNGMIYLASI